MVADDPLCPPPPRHQVQPSPYSDMGGDAQAQSAQYWKDLAESRGQVLRDMTDKWAERRVTFVKAKRAMAETLFEMRTRERTMTRRIIDLERVLLVVKSQLCGVGNAEGRIAMIMPHVEYGLNVQAAYPVIPPTRGGYAGAEQE